MYIMYNTTRIAEMGPIAQGHVKTLLLHLNYIYFITTHELNKTKIILL